MIGVNFFAMVGRLMASAEREPITGSEAEPPAGSRAEPLVRGLGTKPPEAECIFAFQKCK